ncbi:hypothetical protein [Profundibacter sp.]
MSDKSDKRLELEAQANELGLKFPANIGDAKLEKRISAALAKQADARVIGGGLAEAEGSPSDSQDGEPSDEGAAGPNAASAPNTNTPPVAAGEPAANEGPVTSATGPDLPVGYVSITGPKRGRWRAGRHFSATPTVIARTDLTDDEMVAINMDPALTVTESVEE